MGCCGALRGAQEAPKGGGERPGLKRWFNSGVDRTRCAHPGPISSRVRLLDAGGAAIDRKGKKVFKDRYRQNIYPGARGCN